MKIIWMKRQQRVKTGPSCPGLDGRLMNGHGEVGQQIWLHASYILAMEVQEAGHAGVCVSLLAGREPVQKVWLQMLELGWRPENGH